MQKTVILEVFWKKRLEWTRPISRSKFIMPRKRAWASVEGQSERVQVYYDPRRLNLPFIKRWSPVPVDPLSKSIAKPVRSEPIHLSMGPGRAHDFTARGELPDGVHEERAADRPPKSLRVFRFGAQVA